MILQTIGEDKKNFTTPFKLLSEKYINLHIKVQILISKDCTKHNNVNNLK